MTIQNLRRVVATIARGKHVSGDESEAAVLPFTDMMMNHSEKTAYKHYVKEQHDERKRDLCSAVYRIMEEIHKSVKGLTPEECDPRHLKNVAPPPAQAQD